MIKTLKIKKFSMRTWQDEAFEKTKEALLNKRKNFLCVATPGAGKTKYALRVARYILDEKIADRIVVVTPSIELKKNWGFDASIFAGFEIDSDFSNLQLKEGDGFHGIATTYSAVGSDKYVVHKQNTGRAKTFVIFDEPHHLGETLSWGDSAVDSFDGAVFKLLISGTAFRTDDNEIPFIEYENGVSKADYNYGYTRAIKEGVCRPVFFNAFDGQMKWKVDFEEFESKFADYLEPDQVSRRLRTALVPGGNYVRDIIKSANSKLNELRNSTHRNAGGMVFAMTQADAVKIAKVIEELTGLMPPIIISDEGKGSEKIESFRKGSAPWLVSVKMVSEGVDIPRLRVGVYLTNVKAELFFRQAVGRFVRIQKELGNSQEAFIFIPQDRDLVKLAETIQEERNHALDTCEPGAEGETETDLFGNEYTPALDGRFIPLDSFVTGGKVIQTTISSGMKTGTSTTAPEDVPLFMIKKRKKEKINDLSKLIARKSTKGNKDIKPDWKLAHKKWTEAGGKNIDEQNIDELDDRIKFYTKLLRN